MKKLIKIRSAFFLLMAGGVMLPVLSGCQPADKEEAKPASSAVQQQVTPEITSPPAAVEQESAPDAGGYGASESSTSGAGYGASEPESSAGGYGSPEPAPSGGGYGTPDPEPSTGGYGQ